MAPKQRETLPYDAHKPMFYAPPPPPKQTILLPGDYVELKTPNDFDADVECALEPRFDSPSNMNRPPEQAWPNVQTIKSVDHTITLTNATQDPIILKRNEHICQIRHITYVYQIDPNMESDSVCVHRHTTRQ